jgi:hypothetical protein
MKSAAEMTPATQDGFESLIPLEMNSASQFPSRDLPWGCQGIYVFPSPGQHRRHSGQSSQPFLAARSGKLLRRDVPQSVLPAVIFWADLLAEGWCLLTGCIRTGKPAL